MAANPGIIGNSGQRLTVVDALRGFAIASILLLHNIEHFDFYFTAQGLAPWMVKLDNVIWDTLFFLFSGKSYAMFALLFGLTYYIQSHKQEQMGLDFRGRFAWRITLLLGFGIINSAFYQGDILTIYAILGVCLIPVTKLSTKTVFIIALILMLQPVLWLNVIWGTLHPAKEIADPTSWTYFGKATEYITGNSMWATLKGNLTNGKRAVLLWTWENGRVFQTMSLFMLGMLAGRKKLFATTEASLKFWKRALPTAIIAFVVLHVSVRFADNAIAMESIKRPLHTILASWANMGFMAIWVSGFVLVYQLNWGHKMLNVFSPLGRMSLSNYMIQSVLGAFIYYGFGLGLYQYTGATYCVLIGLTLFVIQLWFSRWWFKQGFKQGPFETLWHKATWVKIG